MRTHMVEISCHCVSSRQKCLQKELEEARDISKCQQPKQRTSNTKIDQTSPTTTKLNECFDLELCPLFMMLYDVNGSMFSIFRHIMNSLEWWCAWYKVAVDRCKSKWNDDEEQRKCKILLEQKESWSMAFVEANIVTVSFWDGKKWSVCLCRQG